MAHKKTERSKELDRRRRRKEKRRKLQERQQAEKAGSKRGSAQ